MSNTMYLILILVPAYIVWRHYAAYKVKLRVAEELDAYLGNEEQPELLKKIAFRMYEDSMNPFLAIQVSLWESSKQTKKGNSDLPASVWKRELNQLSEEQKADFEHLIKSCIVINIKVSPLTHLFMMAVGLLKTVTSPKLDLKEMPLSEKELAGTYLSRFSI